MSTWFREDAMEYCPRLHQRGIDRAVFCVGLFTIFMQVRAATPIMAGVFAILRGCKGTEEQEIARAMNVLRGGNPGGFLSELSEREEWQAQREAVMASLVRRALLVHGDGQRRGGAERGVDGRLAVSSRSLQVRGASISIYIYVYTSKYYI